MGSTKSKKQLALMKNVPADALSLPLKVHPVREGEWLPREEFYAEALRLSAGNADVVVDLDGVDYLDASSLQMLLALDAGQKSRTHGFVLKNASPALLCWFEYAGAVKQFVFA